MNSSNETARHASRFETAGALLLATKDWASVPENFPYGLGALILNYILYQSEVVPRWLSGWGLVGVPFWSAPGLAALFGADPTSTIMILLNLPIALQEMVLAVYPIVRGFSPSAIEAGPSE